MSLQPSPQTESGRCLTRWWESTPRPMWHTCPTSEVVCVPLLCLSPQALWTQRGLRGGHRKRNDFNQWLEQVRGISEPNNDRCVRKNLLGVIWKWLDIYLSACLDTYVEFSSNLSLSLSNDGSISGIETNCFLLPEYVSFLNTASSLIT